MADNDMKRQYEEVKRRMLNDRLELAVTDYKSSNRHVNMNCYPNRTISYKDTVKESNKLISSLINNTDDLPHHDTEDSIIIVFFCYTKEKFEKLVELSDVVLKNKMNFDDTMDRLRDEDIHIYTVYSSEERFNDAKDSIINNIGPYFIGLKLDVCNIDIVGVDK